MLFAGEYYNGEITSANNNSYINIQPHYSAITAIGDYFYGIQTPDSFSFLIVALQLLFCQVEYSHDQDLMLVLLKYLSASLFSTVLTWHVC